MRKRCIAYTLAIPMLLGGLFAKGQSPGSLQLTADSLATGNYKDVFKSFFQLAVDRFTSKNKDLSFTSNPFAVMAKMDTTLLVDTNYIKYTHLRNFNFSFSGKLDSAYRFNGFSSGITYALINQRDETVSRAFLAQASKADDEFNRLSLALDQFVTTIPDPAKARKLVQQKDSAFRGLLSFG
jgi:hypothetical protein